ncbi:hypothetical protein PAXINDRAFT_166004 [Paxillus involutus ATCC 200175]|nr:hypothetical protein PAXINDRAFT_166004 [Paxillus involutus ATCC 200175]
MDRMLMWSLKACPLVDTALQALRRISAGKPASILQLDLLAFDATAWTLWTRQAIF